MGIFDGLFGDQETKRETTSQSTVPDWVDKGSKTLFGRSMAELDKGFTPYKGDRVAGFTPDQKTGFDMTRDFVTGGAGGELVDNVRGYATAGPQSIGHERIVDEDGRLGAVSDYLNPYTDDALSSVLNKIYDAADQVRKRTDSSATMANAFGDARHGIVESQNDLNTSRAVGETSSAFMKDAFDTAMGLRGNDLSRFYNTDIANANFEEQALERLRAGSAQEQEMLLQQISSLLGTGQMQQANQQAELDADYQEFLREQGWSNEQIGMAASILGGLPFTRGTTSETVDTQPDNSLMQIIGAIGGAAMAPMTGGMSLMGPAMSMFGGGGGGGGFGPA